MVQLIYVPALQFRTLLPRSREAMEMVTRQQNKTFSFWQHQLQGYRGLPYQRQKHMGKLTCSRYCHPSLSVHPWNSIQKLENNQSYLSDARLEPLLFRSGPVAHQQGNCQWQYPDDAVFLLLDSAYYLVLFLLVLEPVP